MISQEGSTWVLHISDTHISEENQEFSEEVLLRFAQHLEKNHYSVDFVLHSGDIIDFNTSKKEAADPKALAQNRFSIAAEIINKFLEELNITKKRFVSCCGNHDVLRLKEYAARESAKGCNNTKLRTFSSDNHENRRNEYNTFSKDYAPSTNGLFRFPTYGLEICSIDTNHAAPDEKFCCCNCSSCFYTAADSPEDDYFRIVLGHKPLYELCEDAILPYRDGKQTFITRLRQFLRMDGVYVCGDKHTRSMSGIPMLDIPHYMGGCPIKPPTDADKPLVVEYNLFEIANKKAKKIARERLVRIEVTLLGADKASSNSNRETESNAQNTFVVNGSRYLFSCSVSPQKKLISDIYMLCREYSSNRIFKNLYINKEHSTWEQLKSLLSKERFSYLNAFYTQFSSYRRSETGEIITDIPNIFDWVVEKITEKFKQTAPKLSLGRNVLNVRGDNGSGKSSFLGYLFFSLLNRYQNGDIPFIPVLYSLHNDEIEQEVLKGRTYRDAAKQSFKPFFSKVIDLAQKEDSNILCIIDGLDEQDCWSYSTEDSVARGLLDVMACYNKVWFVMAFTRHRLPLFKNTMPVHKVGEASDVLYLRNTEIYSNKTKGFGVNPKLRKLLESYPYMVPSVDKSGCSTDKVCNILQRFSIKTVNLRLLNDHQISDKEALIYKKTNSTNHKSFYTSYYIDKQYSMCFEELGYDFVKYAPPMAYLFGYMGYTFERFMQIAKTSDDPSLPRHIVHAISEHRDQIYKAFIFLKKRSDVCNYLIALHYNSELRFYTENPQKQIHISSVLNQFIYRDIAVIIRKLWTDPNKLIMVIEGMLHREDKAYGKAEQYMQRQPEEEKNDLTSISVERGKTSSQLQDELPPEVLHAKNSPAQGIAFPIQAKSIIVYCIANNSYIDIQNRNRLMDRMMDIVPIDSRETIFDFSRAFFLDNINGKLSAVTEQFLHYTFRRSILLYHKKYREETIKTLCMEKDLEFQKYNKLFQLLYYHDRTVHGHVKKHPLEIEDNLIIAAGFDISNTFLYICSKLKRYFDGMIDYQLVDFDLITLYQLVKDRCGIKIADNMPVEFEYDYFRRNKDNVVRLINTIRAFLDKREIFYSSQTNTQTETTIETLLSSYYKSSQRFFSDFIEKAKPIILLYAKELAHKSLDGTFEVKKKSTDILVTLCEDFEGTSHYNDFAIYCSEGLVSLTKEHEIQEAEAAVSTINQIYHSVLNDHTAKTAQKAIAEALSTALANLSDWHLAKVQSCADTLQPLQASFKSNEIIAEQFARVLSNLSTQKCEYMQESSVQNCVERLQKLWKKYKSNRIISESYAKSLANLSSQNPSQSQNYTFTLQNLLEDFSSNETISASYAKVLADLSSQTPSTILNYVETMQKFRTAFKTNEVIAESYACALASLSNYMTTKAQMCVDTLQELWTSFRTIEPIAVSYARATAVLSAQDDLAQECAAVLTTLLKDFDSNENIAEAYAKTYYNLSCHNRSKKYIYEINLKNIRKKFESNEVVAEFYAKFVCDLAVQNPEKARSCENALHNLWNQFKPNEVIAVAYSKAIFNVADLVCSNTDDCVNILCELRSYYKSNIDIAVAYAMALSTLISQDETKEQECMDILSSLQHDFDYNVTIAEAYTKAASTLVSRDVSKAKNYLSILKELQNRFGSNEIIAEDYAKVLINQAGLDNSLWQECVDILHDLQEIFGSNRVILDAYTNAEFILGYQECLGILSELQNSFKANESVAVAYARALANLATRNRNKSHDYMYTIGELRENFGANETIAESYARVISISADRNESKAQEFTSLLCCLHDEFVANEAIAEAYAKVISILAKTTNFNAQEYEPILNSLQKQFLSSEAIAEIYAKILSIICEGDEENITTIMEYATILDDLQNTFGSSEALAEAYATALANLTPRSDLSIVENNVRLLRELHHKFSKNEEIATLYSIGLVNLSAEQNLETIQDSINTLEELHHNFFNRAEIIECYAKGLVNLSLKQDSTGACFTAEKLKDLYNNELSKDLDDIALSYAMCLFNLNLKQDSEDRQKTLDQLRSFLLENRKISNLFQKELDDFLTDHPDEVETYNILRA